MATDARLLIVNADDFGQSLGVNRGIVEAHERGIVTSASLMTRWPAATDAVGYWRSRRSLGLGLHLDLGEWKFLDGTWVPRYQTVDLDDSDSVAAEITRQLEQFHRLTDAAPTHIDSHQHVHLRPQIRDIAIAAAARLGVPLRHCDPEIGYCGDFFGQDERGVPLHDRIHPSSLQRLLRNLPHAVTELACHPGFADDLETTYRRERAMEVDALCDPSLREICRQESIELASFERIARHAEQ